MSSIVYDRISKLSLGDALGDTNLNLIVMAILNLNTEEEIREFVLTYKEHYPSDWRNDISYTLGFYTSYDRELWHKSVGDLIGINILWNRSERELWTQFTYVDDKGNDIKLKENVERGNHQSK